MHRSETIREMITNSLYLTEATEVIFYISRREPPSSLANPLPIIAWLAKM